MGGQYFFDKPPSDVCLAEEDGTVSDEKRDIEHIVYITNFQ